MFTNKKYIEELIHVKSITPINKGVMTDKYEYTYDGVEYIVRCYPSNREYLADAEYSYMQLFRQNEILAPEPIKHIRDKNVSLLIYKKLKGEPLSEIWESLDETTKDKLCQQIVDNYEHICTIKCDGFGQMKAYQLFSHSSWSDFEVNIISKAKDAFRGVLETEQSQDFIENWIESSSGICKDSHNLVWSDFSMDNIIVSENGCLVGFVDFEGLMSGDHLLGIGYLLAHENNSVFYNKIEKVGKYSNQRNAIDYFAKMRYLRLLPYKSFALPNGDQRESLNSFLPYVSHLFNNKTMCANCFQWYKIRRWTIMLVCIIACALSFIFSPNLYQKVLDDGVVSVKIDSTLSQIITGDVPIWMNIKSDTIYVRKYIGSNEKSQLYALVEHNANSSDKMTSYCRLIDDLAFQSSTFNNNDIMNLILLTLCFVILGCSARTFYDYIGNMCFKKEKQNMSKWWPWYLYRLLLGSPIAAFIIVASRCALFSFLFTVKDLSAYLVIAFFAGFSMMEFLDMLRSISKGLFSKYNN